VGVIIAAAAEGSPFAAMLHILGLFFHAYCVVAKKPYLCIFIHLHCIMHDEAQEQLYHREYNKILYQNYNLIIRFLLFAHDMPGLDNVSVSTYPCYWYGEQNFLFHLIVIKLKKAK
jgi:hypothetical protein